MPRVSLAFDQEDGLMSMRVTDSFEEILYRRGNALRDGRMVVLHRAPTPAQPHFQDDRVAIVPQAIVAVWP